MDVRVVELRTPVEGSRSRPTSAFAAPGMIEAAMYEALDRWGRSESWLLLFGSNGVLVVCP
jgi:hypothetical protein